MKPFDILTILGVIFCTFIILFFYWKRKEIFIELPLYYNGKWSLPIDISKEYLGYIEGNNKLLKEVIVIAHRLEDPGQDIKLLQAVKNNFKKNIPYRFIISNSSFEEEKKKYIKIFEAYANSATLTPCTRDLIKVNKLGCEWKDVPYIFYFSKQEFSSSSNDTFIFGYRGIKTGEGIDERYILMEPSHAYTVFKLVETLIGEKIVKKIELSNFDGLSNIIEISQKRTYSKN